MTATTFIVIDRHGVKRATKRRPNLRSGEVMVRLNISVSDRFFAANAPVANLTIPDSAVVTPEVKVEVKP